MVARLWTARYDVHWRPLLTYRSRREALAEWIDNNVDVYSVLDRQEALGVAVGHRAVRVVIRRQGLEVSVGTPDADMEQVGEVVKKAFELLKPSDLHVAGIRSTRTVDLTGDYDSLRLQLAHRSVASDVGGVDLLDCAVRTDFKTPSADMQLEFGVVNEEELRDRLTKPEGDETSTALPPGRDLGQLPSVALFGDVIWMETTGLPHPDADTVEALWNHFEAAMALSHAECESVMDGIARSLEPKGGRDEFSCGA